jgi:hypothetical protein
MARSGYGRHLTTAAIKAAKKYGPRIVSRMAQNVVAKYRARKRGGHSLRGAKTASSSEIKTLKAHSEAIQDGTGGQISTHTFINNKSKLSAIEKRMIRPVEYTVNGASQINSSVGRQFPESLIAMFHQTDLATIFTNAPLPASGAGATTSYPSVLLESSTVVVQMMNAANSSLSLTIYDILAKRDASVANSFAPDAAWATGSALENAANAYLVAGALPTDSDLFNQFYRIQKRTSVVLAPGNVHRHEVFSFPHRVVSKALNSYIGSGGNIGGLTSYVMVVINGAPDSDQVTGTQVSLGAAYLNYTIQNDYRFRWMMSNQPDIIKTVSLPQSYTVGEETINPETGGAQAYTPL